MKVFTDNNRVDDIIKGELDVHKFLKVLLWRFAGLRKGFSFYLHLILQEIKEL